MSDDFETQTVIIREAGSAPAPFPKTTGASSVFAMAGAGKRRVTYVAAPDPTSLKVVSIPKPGRKGAPPSRWEAVYESMPEGKAIELNKAQALAFASWSRSHKKTLKRQRINAFEDRYAVWRPSAA